MFSNNGKISSRQYRRMLILTTIGFTSLVLPRMLVEESNSLGIYSFFLGIGFMVLFLFLEDLLRKSSFGHALSAPGKLRSILEKCGLVIYLIVLLIAGGFLLQLESGFVKEMMLQEVPLWFIMVLFLFVCAYGCIGGGEDQMRAGEFLYLFILIPFILLFLMTVKNLSFTELTNVFLPEKFSLTQLFSGAIATLSFFLPFFFFLKRRQELVNKNEGLRASYRALLICFSLCSLLYIFTVGIFGRAGVASQTWSLTYLMDQIVFPGGFLGKGAVLLSGFWIISVFLVLSEILHFLREKVIHITGYAHPRIVLVILLATIFVISTLMGSPQKAEKIYRTFMSHIGLWLVLLASLFVTGCGAPPESRNFVLAIGIDANEEVENNASSPYCVTFGMPDLSKVADQDGGQETQTSVSLTGKSLSTIRNTYEYWSGREIDYAHVKAFVIEEKVFEQEDFKDELFSLVESGDIGEDAVLFLSDIPAKEILEAAEKEGGAAGLYLEDFYQNNPLMKAYGEVTIGDYYYACLKEKNGEMVRAKTSDMLVPVLVVTKERPTISQMKKINP